MAMAFIPRATVARLIASAQTIYMREHTGTFVYGLDVKSGAQKSESAQRAANKYVKADCINKNGQMRQNNC